MFSYVLCIRPDHNRRPSAISVSMSTLKRKVGTDSNGVDSSKKPKQDGSIMSFFGAPKTAGANGSTSTAMNDGPPAPKFDKAKWVASLTPEQRTLLKLEIDTMDESWLAHLKDELVTSRFLDLKRFLDNETKMERQWFPPKEDVYSWYDGPSTPYAHHMTYPILPSPLGLGIRLCTRSGS